MLDPEDILPALITSGEDDFNDDVECGSEDWENSDVEEGSFLQLLSCPGQGREDRQQLPQAKLVSTPAVVYERVCPLGTAASAQ